MAEANFNIIDWHANSAGLETKDAWGQWIQSDFSWPEKSSVAVDKIPAMARRRMSTLSKLAVQNALVLAEEQSIDYLVFSSRHGELTRTAALLQDIINGDDASPMAFSQSVHNTAAGLFTITAKQPIPVTSIAAGVNTFHSAIVEAAAYLSENPLKKVLIIDFDEPLPECYEEYETQTYQGYALGLILGAGNQFSLQWGAGGACQNTELPHALQFISYLLGGKSEWELEGITTQWKWTRS